MGAIQSSVNRLIGATAIAAKAVEGKVAEVQAENLRRKTVAQKAAEGQIKAIAQKTKEADKAEKDQAYNDALARYAILHADATVAGRLQQENRVKTFLGELQQTQKVKSFIKDLKGEQNGK